MRITSRRGFRRVVAVTAAIAWLASSGIVVTVLVTGKHYGLHVALLFCLTVAATATITGLVGGSVAPVQATYRHVYNAGWQDCQRELGGLVVIPESRMADKRADHAS